MLYDIGFLIFSIAYLPALIFKGKLHGDFAERFGFYGKAKTETLRSAKGAIWIQAVSVGEVSLCRSLIPELKRAFPGKQIVLSTITKTGNDLAKKVFAGQATVIYFPLDFSFSVKRSIELICPKLYVMIETEIWPNFLGRIKRSGAHSILVNGRISDRSIASYRLVKVFLRKALNNIDLFCMQSASDADRIIELGAPADRVNITGNMKFDSAQTEPSKPVGLVLRSLGFSFEDTIFVAGSTHPGEDEMIVRAFAGLLKEFPAMKLVIAPRHIERVPDVESILQKAGLSYGKFTQLQSGSSGSSARKVVIVDTIGQLNDIYAAASIVFVGGSLVPHGGQNPLEPAAIGRAVIFGPHMFNFKDIAENLLSGAGALQVNDDSEIVESVRQILKDASRNTSMGINAKNIVIRNKGATQKNIEAMTEIAR